MPTNPTASIPHLKDRIRRFLELAHLGQWESAAVVHLLFHGDATPQGLASTTGIPKNKVYDVLNHLVRRGLAYTEFPGAKNYHAVHPDVLFERLVREAHEMDAIQREILPALVQQFHRSADAASRQENELLPTVTDSAAAMSSMLLRDLRTCHSEVMIAGHDLGWISESPPLIDQLEAAAERGVTVRILSDDRGQLERILAGHGALQGRVPDARPLPSPIIVVGRRAIYMGVVPGPGRVRSPAAVYVRIRSPDLTADMVRLFRETWENGKDLVPSTGVPSP